MDFNLTEQQEILRRSAREFLEAECPTSLVREVEELGDGHAADLWRKMAGLGWLGISLPEQYGGTGGNFADLGSPKVNAAAASASAGTACGRRC